MSKTFDSRGAKYDAGKPRMDLVLRGFPQGLLEVAKVLTFGANKYAAHAWKNVPNAVSRYEAALLRHLIAHSKGEVVDPESGLPHLAHAACNMMFLLELNANGAEYNPE